MTPTAVLPTIDTLARRLANLRARRRELDLEIEDAEVALVRAMRAHDDVWEVELPELGIVKRHSGTKRTEWRHDELWDELGRFIRSGAKRLMDEDTGQIESPADTALRIVREAARPSWRITALKGFGIDPDEFCSVSYGRQTIELVLPEGAVHTAKETGG